MYKNSISEMGEMGMIEIRIKHSMEWEIMLYID